MVKSEVPISFAGNLSMETIWEKEMLFVRPSVKEGEPSGEGEQAEAVEGEVMGEVVVPEVFMHGVVTDKFVVVNGSQIANSSSLKTMWSASEFLGIAKSGGKATVFEGLQRALRETEAQAALEAARRERQAQVRAPEERPRALQPSEEEKRKHNLTHLPFAEWCEACQATRSRDSERHQKRQQAVPTISIHYMHTNTGVTPVEQGVKHLIAVDNWSKALLAIPIRVKGAGSLKECCMGLCGFMREYEKVILKGDQEPSLQQLMKAVANARTSLNLVIYIFGMFPVG